MQVLGCQSRRFERARRPASATHRDQWPAVNGTVCLCYDTHDAQCVATCATDIQSYSVRQASGTGLVMAKCPQGTVVLGCGSVAQTASRSRYRAAVVALRTSCRCYDDQGVRCYAVCGLLMPESSYSGASRNSAAAKFRLNLASKAITLCIILLITLSV